MSDETSFRDLLRRFRGGDNEAAHELERQYKPEILRVVRLRLTDRRLRRVFESADVWQSIMGDFYKQVAKGNYDPKTPQELIGLLVRMAQNKVIDYARREKRHRHDQHIDPRSLDQVAGQPAESPSELAERQELEAIMSARLTPEERYLCEQKSSGRSWKEIATQVGGHPDALRMKWQRAQAKLVDRFGLKEDDHV
jgi:RNA polymerase sigma factor (sigma-70 family)